jgi:hypothetical protein
VPDRALEGVAFQEGNNNKSTVWNSISSEALRWMLLRANNVSYMRTRWSAPPKLPIGLAFIVHDRTSDEQRHGYGH